MAGAGERVVVTKEAGQTTGSNARPVLITDGHEIMSSEIVEQASFRPTSCNKDEWLIHIMTDGDKQGSRSDQNKARIQRVPQRLREIEANKKCFDPTVLAIGPYHRGNPEFEIMEKHKIASVRRFVNNSGKSIHVFYEKIVEVATNARECYADGSTTEFNDEEFARMMFLDGCFVLHFIDCIVNNKQNELTTCSYLIAFSQRDLFLLENQLPFVVLQALMDLRFPGDKEMINNFIGHQIGSQSYSFKGESNATTDGQPLHLLNLLRTKLLGPNPMCGSAQQNNADWQSFRSVKELRAVGINFKKSHTSCLKNVKFKSYKVYGDLHLPPIVIDDTTKPKFLNLIAYEMCPDTPSDYAVTSYICFLDSLIDHAEDVKELRSKGILLNFLGSDEQVSDLFNQLATDLVPDAQAYSNIKAGIEKHYKNKTKVSIVEFLHAHFNSPWTAFAFFAASFVIVLTCVQTFFAAFPPP